MATGESVIGPLGVNVALCLETTSSAPGARGVRLGFEEFFVVESAAMVRLTVALVDWRERAEEIVRDAFVRTLLA